VYGPLDNAVFICFCEYTLFDESTNANNPKCQQTAALESTGSIKGHEEQLEVYRNVRDDLAARIKAEFNM
jgi:hypothetical protein